MDIDKALKKVGEQYHKLMAAKEEGEGMVKLYTAALMKGNEEEIEKRRQEVLAHMEYVLDLMKEVFKQEG